MNSQNTPVHIHLWHHDFWRMSVANLLITASVYLLLPSFPLWLMESRGMNASEVGIALGVFGLGLFLLGMFTSYLVQHFRRNVVCIYSLLGTIACLGALYYINCRPDAESTFYLVVLQRFLMGASFGLSQMILSSTLIIDTCESFQRTEANHAAAWFSRFAMSLGPIAGFVVYSYLGFSSVLLATIASTSLAIVLILLVHFPFRSPNDRVSVVSLDRFFLPHGTILFVNLLLITLAGGLLLSLALSLRFYAMMMVGFMLAILAQRFVFLEAELKSEVVSGLVLMIAAIVMMLTRSQAIVGYVAPLFISFSLGIIGSRFLLFFIKLSRHCQRGTSQSSFMLGWESGIALGLGLGYGVCQRDSDKTLILALVLVMLALALYQYTHSWFLAHKNR